MGCRLRLCGTSIVLPADVALCAGLLPACGWLAPLSAISVSWRIHCFLLITLKGKGPSTVSPTAWGLIRTLATEGGDPAITRCSLPVG